jgi:conjugative transfer signal peptidase TraF
MKARLATFLMMLGGVVLVSATLIAKPTAKYLWNASPSVPIGLYRLKPIGSLVVTELVAVQPPERLATWLADDGYLPRGVPMLKRVLALPGQIVCRQGFTITIDAIEIGLALERDRQGRPLPAWQGCHVIVQGEVFLMNRQSEDSLDGRYFGALPTAAIVARAEPLWADGSE